MAVNVEKQKAQNGEPKNKRSGALGSALIVTIFFALIGLVVGRNDWLALILLVVFIAFLFDPIVAVRNTLRSSIRNNLKEGAPGYEFLGNDMTALRFAIASVVSLVIGVSFFVYYSAAIITHSLLATLFFTLVSVYFLIYSLSARSNLDLDSLNESIDNKFDLLRLVTYAMLTSLAFALIFSAKDLYDFFRIGQEITISNFVGFAEEKAVDRTGVNPISRALINLYIVVDTFKVALIVSFIKSFGMDVGYGSGGSFYLFYFFSVLVNYLKSLPFSFAVVFFVAGYVRHFYVFSAGFYNKAVSLASWSKVTVKACIEKLSSKKKTVKSEAE